MKTVFCDWGTTNLRAYLIENGEVINTFTSDKGLKSAKDLGFENVLNEIYDQLEITKDTPIKLSGMIGSKHGWKEAPYVEAPVSLDDIKDNYVLVDGSDNTQIYGGVSYLMPDGRRDVMRGEEVQIFGILKKYPDAKKICLLGTHAKWVNIANAAIDSFQTWMTGDFFNCLSGYTIFKQQISSEDFNQEAFLKGLDSAKESKSILNDTFYLRTDYLFGKVNGDEFHSYLSGFLIGNEIKGAAGDCKEVYLSGSERMVPYYKLALEYFGIKAIEILSSEATVFGMQEISQECANV